MALRLSKEYGVNAGLDCCFVCGKEIGVILFGANHGKKAPMYSTSGNLCDKCKQFINSGGSFILAAKEGKDGKPERTGGYVGLLKEQVDSISNSKSRIVFMEDKLFNNIFGKAIKEKEEEQKQEETNEKS